MPPPDSPWIRVGNVFDEFSLLRKTLSTNTSLLSPPHILESVVDGDFDIFVISSESAEPWKMHRRTLPAFELSLRMQALHYEKLLHQEEASSIDHTPGTFHPPPLTSYSRSFSGLLPRTSLQVVVFLLVLGFFSLPVHLLGQTLFTNKLYFQTLFFLLFFIPSPPLAPDWASPRPLSGLPLLSHRTPCPILGLPHPTSQKTLIISHI